jgi:hypothetical protein
MSQTNRNATGIVTLVLVAAGGAAILHSMLPVYWATGLTTVLMFACIRTILYIRSRSLSKGPPQQG